MKTMKKTLVAAALTGAFIGSANASTAVDNKASVDTQINITMGKVLGMKAPDHINFGRVQLGQDAVAQSSFCIYTNSANNTYKIKAASTHSFKLVNSGTGSSTDAIVYSPSLVKANGDELTELTTAENTVEGAANSSNCGGSNNVALKIEIKSSDLESKTDGIYKDQITLTATAV